MGLGQRQLRRVRGREAKNHIANSDVNSQLNLPTGITERVSPKKTDQTKNQVVEKNSDILSILFCNINGLSRQKLDRLSILSENDHMICLNETNYRENDCALLTQAGLGELCAIKSLNKITYKNGEPVEPSKKVGKKRVKSTKRSGFGTAMTSKLATKSEIFKHSGDHEILYSILKLDNLCGAVITGYRSPSMGVPYIENYYQALDETIVQIKTKINYDFLIFVGDDNSSEKSKSHRSKTAASNLKIVMDKYQMVDLIPGVCTRGKHQPDSCFAYFDPEKVDICANLLAGLAATGADHELIQIQLKKSEIVAEPVKFKKMKRTKCIVNSKKLQCILENYLSEWNRKWSPKIDPNMNGKTLSKAASSLTDTLNRVKNICYKKQVKNVHKNAKSDDNDTNLNILRLRALVSKFAWNIKNNNKDIESRKKLIDVNIQLEKAINTAAVEKLEIDMRKQVDAERKNDSSFWDLTGSLLNKSAYQTSINRKINEEEIKEKLEFYDTTFINSSPDFLPDYKSFSNIKPLKSFKLNSDSEFIETLIEKTHKIKPFIKDNRKIISKAISTIVKMMDIVKEFPESCNNSNCHIIGRTPKERIIFSLEAIPKILENVSKNAFDEIKIEDGTYQMAYTKDRGCVSCNVMTLQYIEMCNEPTLHSLQDLKKAFNRACRETIINEAQKKFGAGQFFKSWFLNRTYQYSSEFGTIVRGLNHNQGVPAGTLLGVEGFLLFIASCTELTGQNLKLLWAALYADDTSPLVKKSNIVDFQKALDWACEWAKEKGCEFHLTGDKKPVYLAYLKRNENFPVEFDDVNLGGVSLTRKAEETVLGLYRKVRPIGASSEESQGKMIDKYGYECAWDESKLKSIAYRLQRVKYSIVPQFMKKLVSAYFCGIVRFSASVIWLRSPIKHHDRIRFFYCMALAACLGLSAAEALNLSCCKNMSVSKDNSSYLKLISETGLPSLEHMASLDAVSVINQVSKLKPDWFLKGTTRQQAKARLFKKDGIVGVRSKLKNTLVASLLDLKNRYHEVHEPETKIIEEAKNKLRNEFKKKSRKS